MAVTYIDPLGPAFANMGQGLMAAVMQGIQAKQARDANFGQFTQFMSQAPLEVQEAIGAAYAKSPEGREAFKRQFGMELDDLMPARPDVKLGDPQGFGPTGMSVTSRRTFTAKEPEAVVAKREDRALEREATRTDIKYKGALTAGQEATTAGQQAENAVKGTARYLMFQSTYGDSWKKLLPEQRAAVAQGTAPTEVLSMLEETPQALKAMREEAQALGMPLTRLQELRRGGLVAETNKKIIDDKEATENYKTLLPLIHEQARLGNELTRAQIEKLRAEEAAGRAGTGGGLTAGQMQEQVEKSAKATKEAAETLSLAQLEIKLGKGLFGNARTSKLHADTMPALAMPATQAGLDSLRKLAPYNPKIEAIISTGDPRTIASPEAASEIFLAAARYTADKAGVKDAATLGPEAFSASFTWVDNQGREQSVKGDNGLNELMNYTLGSRNVAASLQGLNQAMAVSPAQAGTAPTPIPTPTPKPTGEPSPLDRAIEASSADINALTEELKKRGAR